MKQVKTITLNPGDFAVVLYADGGKEVSLEPTYKLREAEVLRIPIGGMKCTAYDE